MGGGLEFESLVEHVTESISNLNDNTPQVSGRDNICKSYDSIFKQLKDAEPGSFTILHSCAASVEFQESVQRAAARYKEIEIATESLVVRAQSLVNLLLQISEPLADALTAGASGAREALSMTLSALEDLHTRIAATAALHAAIARDVAHLAKKAHTISQDPSKADVGLVAAPLIAGTTTSAIASVVLRGLGPFAILAIPLAFAAAAAGTSSVTSTTLHPALRQHFGRYHATLREAATLMQRKSRTLDRFASVMQHLQLATEELMEVPAEGRYDDSSAEQPTSFPTKAQSCLQSAQESAFQFSPFIYLLTE